jgi:hypothetical protein
MVAKEVEFVSTKLLKIKNIGYIMQQIISKMATFKSNYDIIDKKYGIMK